MLPKVLVLLCSYNGDQWVGEQLETIFAQKGVHVELSVRDDGSTDNTVNIIRSLSADYDCSIEIEADRRGSTSGLNFIKHILEKDFVNKFDYVALSDQDDLWHLGRLERAIRLMQKNKADAYSSSVEAFWPSGKRKIVSQDPRHRAFDFLFEGGGQGCTFVMTGDCFIEIQKFIQKHFNLVREFYFHDWLIFLLVRCWGKTWHFDCLPTINYRQHTHNVAGVKHGFKAKYRRIQLIRSGWYRKQIQLATHIADLAVDENDRNFARAKHLLLIEAPGFWRNIKLALLVSRSGRRGILDRTVLVVSALFGYI
jgi:rhamnosyltransferase